MPRIAIQSDLFGGPALDQIVNVASVPQLSPFRYPGGKTWLIPRIRMWLGNHNGIPSEFVEPFAGGGIVSLSVANESLAARVIMCELDDEVAAVWKTIFSEDAIWLSNEILRFELTVENVRKILASAPNSVREAAFQTILKNRTYHGGILAPGSSLLKHGENGRGIKSRWYPETLSKRIRYLRSLQDKITFVQGDGISLLNEKSDDREVRYFIDPPYTAGRKRAGNRLYRHHQLDHEELFRTASRLKGEFLMTYDSDEGVLELAKKFNFDTELIAMKNTHHAEMKELLISRDLGWARR